MKIFFSLIRVAGLIFMIDSFIPKSEVVGWRLSIMEAGIGITLLSIGYLGLKCFKR
jgi:hypothetical protein